MFDDEEALVQDSGPGDPSSIPRHRASLFFLNYNLIDCLSYKNTVIKF